MIIFDEVYVSEEDLDRTYRKAGLHPYLATLDRDEPLPTLRQLIRSGKRVIVLTERAQRRVRVEPQRLRCSSRTTSRWAPTRPSAFKGDATAGSPPTRC